MTNKELQDLLKKYPDDMPIKLLHTHEMIPQGGNRYKFKDAIEFTEENILHTSETAYVDADAPEDQWDNEDGKIELGDGQRYLLFNPIIL